MMLIAADSTPSTRRTRVRPQYLCFGGKGGNGKTTCAAAQAVELAEHGQRVLVVSTDPAHSLGDILARKLTARPSKVSVRSGSLKACELDADRALVRWLARRRPALAAIFQRGTILDRSDIDRFLDLSLPGVDELLGLLELERLAAEDDYDAVVIDTAPTGHTLRLLATPALFTSIAGVLNLMEEKHRVLAAVFGRGVARDSSEALIDELRRDGERLRERIRDRTRMRICWVMLPEEMSVSESRRALASLTADGIHASDIIVNRVTPAPEGDCILCDGRRRDEAEWLNVIKNEWSRQETVLWSLSALEEPPQGVAALRAVARSVSRLRSARRSAQRAKTPARTLNAPSRKLPAALRPSPSTRLLIVGGKGGVGKTTCAATLALAIAHDAPNRRVLLLSTDPAHSIGDVLGEPVGDSERRITGSGGGTLVVREIDATAGWHDWRERYRESITHLFERLGAGPHADLAVDRAIVEDLFELAPPGMDEIVGVAAMIDALLPDPQTRALEGGSPPASRYDLVIIDSAPTGHTLRLLELPAQARAWVKQLMGVLLKYHLAGGSGQLGTDLVWLSRGLGRLQALLTNSRACGFIVVTRPEQLPALETIRLIEWLRRHQIARRALIVNSLTPIGCARCRRTAARERRQLAVFTGSPGWKRSGCRIVLTDAVAPPPRGVAALNAWASTWHARATS